MTSYGASNLSVKHVLQDATRNSRPPLALLSVTETDLEHWRTTLRHELWALLGGPGQLVTPNVEVLTRVSERGFTRSLLHYETEPGVTTSAWLLEPAQNDRRPRPGFLALHGHGSGKDDVVGVADSIDARHHIAERNYDYGRQLVRRGYVVLVPDARGFGARASAEGCHVPGLVALYQGRCIAGQRLWDDLRSLDVLAGLANVDAHRLCCGGLSEGGKRSLLLAALDERVCLTVVSGYFTSLRAEIEAWDRLTGWDICNAIPGLLRVADLPDVAALIAPRRLVIEIGRADSLYTQAAVLQGFNQARVAWEMLDVADGVALDHFDGGHEWSGRIAYKWLRDLVDRPSAMLDPGRL